MSKEANDRRKAKQLHKKALRNARKRERECKLKERSDLIQSVVEALTPKVPEVDLSITGRTPQQKLAGFGSPAGFNGGLTPARLLQIARANYSELELQSLASLYSANYLELRELVNIQKFYDGTDFTFPKLKK